MRHLSETIGCEKHKATSTPCCPICMINMYNVIKASHNKLVEALNANVRRCGYINDRKRCNKIGRHMWDDYDACTEYRCDEHKDRDHLNRKYSGIFKPSDIANEALKQVEKI